MAENLADLVQAAGVVGAGGAGFPTHVKLKAQAEYYIANAAECEPLLFKDQELMKLHAFRMVDGLRRAMMATGATKGVIAIKKKYTAAINALKEHAGSDIDFYYYESFYPAGDEYIIVYDVTGRLIPPGGIPLAVGCVVNNVETLINISLAAEGVPVTHTALTVTGAVNQPISLVVPIGITARECLDLAGGAAVPDPVAIDGGAMMGGLVFDLNHRVTKTSSGFIMVPRDHHLVRRKSRPMEVNVKIARSACDQCMFCTEFCPRYLLGYAIEPHKVMRSVGFSGEKEAAWAQMGLLCCECSVCELYACPEDLPPKQMCVRSKQIWRELPDKPAPLVGLGRAHPMRDARRIPISRLVRRLDLLQWDKHAPMRVEPYAPDTVRLMLSQHIGAPAAPVVQQGDSVKMGDRVATVPDGSLGAHIHASIDGRVSRIDETSIWIQR